MKNYILKYFPFYGLAIFFLCNIIAMYFYAGGSFSNPENTGYDFTLVIRSIYTHIYVYIDIYCFSLDVWCVAIKVHE